MIPQALSQPTKKIFHKTRKTIANFIGKDYIPYTGNLQKMYLIVSNGRKRLYKSFNEGVQAFNKDALRGRNVDMFLSDTGGAARERLYSTRRAASRVRINERTYVNAACFSELMNYEDVASVFLW